MFCDGVAQGWQIGFGQRVKYMTQFKKIISAVPIIMILLTQGIFTKYK